MSQFGRAEDLLNAMAPSMGAPAEFAVSRLRVTPEFEQQYVEVFRSASIEEGLAIDLDEWTDDQLVYLGYLYCVGIDVSSSAEQAVTVVVGTVASSQGRAPEAATEDDAALGVAAARYAGTSICGEHRQVTEDLLVRLGASRSAEEGG